jgi:hypothetical protein
MKVSKSSKRQPLSPKELDKFEAGRDLGAEVLGTIREMRSGKLVAGTRLQTTKYCVEHTCELPAN